MNISKIEWTPYKLIFPQPPNSQSDRNVQPGVYAMVSFDDGLVTRSCLQSWPGLGDPSLEQCLQDLKARDRKNPLVDKTLYWAELARDVDVSQELAAAHSFIENSHRLVFSETEPTVLNGQQKLKMKVGLNMDKEIAQLKQWHELNPNIQLRLDFNGKMNLGDFEYWFKDMGCLAENIEFIEDPMDYDYDLWMTLKKKYSVALALDIQAQELILANEIGSDAVDVVCCKPARNRLELMANWCVQHNKKLLFTHYMDSPLGQAFAIYEARRFLQSYPQLGMENGLAPHMGLLEAETPQ